MVGRTCEKDAWKSDGVMVGESSESWSDKRRKRRVNGKNTGTKLRKTAQKLEVTGKPVGKCLHPGTRALPRTHGRTTRKHNTSGPIYGTGGSRKISFHKKSLWRDRCESPNSSRVCFKPSSEQPKLHGKWFALSYAVPQRSRETETAAYHIVSEIYSAHITKRTQTIGALQKSAEC